MKKWEEWGLVVMMALVMVWVMGVSLKIGMEFRIQSSEVRMEKIGAENLRQKKWESVALAGEVLSVGGVNGDMVVGELTLDRIFGGDHGWIEDLSEDEVVELVATGDVMLGRVVNKRMVESGDFTWPFLKIAGVLREADVSLINLEGPWVENCGVTSEGMRFCSYPRSVEGLRLAGVDVVNLANNHMGDYGERGSELTRRVLVENWMGVSGLGEPAYVEVKGVKFGFLGYNLVPPRVSGVEWGEAKKVVEGVTDLKGRVDVVVVFFHWGSEYTSKPGKQQRGLGRMAIEAGADLVIGNHPHWVQPVEIYQGGVIAYSLGNLVFDQMWSEKTREGVVGRYVFYRGRMVDVEFLPVKIEDWGQPRWMVGDEGERVLEEMRVGAERLGGEF